MFWPSSIAGPRFELAIRTWSAIAMSLGRYICPSPSPPPRRQIDLDCACWFPRNLAAAVGAIDRAAHRMPTPIELDGLRAAQPPGARCHGRHPDGLGQDRFIVLPMLSYIVCMSPIVNETDAAAVPYVHPRVLLLISAKSCCCWSIN
jgi:hypothetical protein